jgi:hypothetical protein
MVKILEINKYGNDENKKIKSTIKRYKYLLYYLDDVRKLNKSNQ